MDRFSAIDNLKGVGEKSRKLFEKLEIRTLDDLLTYYPRDYRKFEEPVQIRKLQSGQTVAVLAQALAEPKIVEAVAGKQLLKQIYVPNKLVNFVAK